MHDELQAAGDSTPDNLFKESESTNACTRWLRSYKAGKGLFGTISSSSLCHHKRVLRDWSVLG